MLIEDLLILLAATSSIFLIGIPMYRIVNAVIPKKKDPLKEAKERLEQARLEQEAARLNKETEKLYEHMYDDDLPQDEADAEQKKGAGK
jgi:hypothetical protein